MTYDEFIGAASSLAPDEFWCVVHPDGPLADTASKDMGACVRIFCTALDIDWDDACENGFSLGRVRLAGSI